MQGSGSDCDLPLSGMKLFSKRKQLSLSPVFILSITFGLVGGVVGELVADVYLDPWRDQYLIDRMIELSNGKQVTPELRRIQKFLGVEQDFQVQKVVTAIAPSAVDIYVRKAPSTSVLNQAYTPKDIRASGVVFTSDGWIITSGSAIADTRREQLVVSQGGKIYNVDQIISDKVSGIAFLKIAASNLSVVVMGDSDEASSGQLAVVVSQNQRAAVTTILDSKYRQIGSSSDYELSSEAYAYRFILASDGTGITAGSPLTNLGGEVIGIVGSIDAAVKRVSVIPINYLSVVSASMLRTGSVVRPILGISYVDIARTPGLSSEVTQGRDRGVLVLENPVKGSPAALAGLKQNDIIQSVDGTLLDIKNDLSSLIQGYKPGDKVDLLVIRAGKEIGVTVMLGTAK